MAVPASSKVFSFRPGVRVENVVLLNGPICLQSEAPKVFEAGSYKENIFHHLLSTLTLSFFESKLGLINSNDRKFWKLTRKPKTAVSCPASRVQNQFFILEHPPFVGFIKGTQLRAGKRTTIICNRMFFCARLRARMWSCLI